MATHTVNIPTQNGNRFFDLVSPSNWNSRSALTTVIKNIKSDYGDIIKNVGKMSNVPPELIVYFMTIESGGKKNQNDGYNSWKKGASDGSIMGLMQWNGKMVFEMLEREKNTGRLTQAEEELFKKHGIMFVKVGKKYQISGSGVVIASNGHRVITAKTSVIPEVNILVGAIKIGYMMDSDWASTNGELRLDKMVYAYNLGPNASDLDKAKKINADTLDPTKASLKYPSNVKQFKEYKVAQIDKGGAGNYVSKMLGKNGVMDIIHNDLPDLFK